MADLETKKARSEGQDRGTLPDPSGAGRRSSWRRRWAVLKRDGPAWLVAGAAFINGLLQVFRVLVGPVIPDRLEVFGLLPFGLHYWNRSSAPFLKDGKRRNVAYAFGAFALGPTPTVSLCA